MNKLVSWYLNLKMSKKLMLSYSVVILISLFLAIAFSYNLSEKYMSYVIAFGKKSVEQSKEQMTVKMEAIEQDLYYKCSGSPYINFQLSPADENRASVSDKLKYKAAAEYILGSNRQYEFVFFCDKNNTFTFAKGMEFDEKLTEFNNSVKEERLHNEALYLKSLWGNCEWESVNDELCVLKRAVYNSTTLKYVGFIAVGIRTNEIIDIFADSMPEQSGFTVFNSKGKPVLYSSANDLSKCTSILNNSSANGAETKTLKKNDVFAGQLQTQNKKYNIVYIFSASVLAKDFLGMTKWNILASFLLFGLAVIFAVLISSNISKNIKILLNRLKSLTDGDLESKIEPLSNDEIGELAVQFNNMSEKISGLVDELSEQKMKKQQVEYQLLEQRYSTLQSQLNPHFLYNVLESISSMAKLQNAPEVSKLVCTLSALLRDSLNQSSKLVPLKQELEHVKKYTELYKTMYGEKISFVFEDISETLLQTLVPCFILQPLIENAIIHGIYKKHDNGTVTIKAVKTSKLKIIIEDNGVGISAAKLKKLLKEQNNSKAENARIHIGVASVKSRIQLLFGKSYGVGINSKEGEGTRVSVTLPLNAEKYSERQGTQV